MIWFLLIWSMSTLALMALASSMQKHQKQIFNQLLDDGKTRLATMLGWTGLAISLALCFVEAPPSNAISYWLAVLSFAATAVLLLLSYYPQHSKRFALILLILSLVCGIAQLF